MAPALLRTTKLREDRAWRERRGARYVYSVSSSWFGSCQLITSVSSTYHPPCCIHSVSTILLLAHRNASRVSYYYSVQIYTRSPPASHERRPSCWHEMQRQVPRAKHVHYCGKRESTTARSSTFHRFYFTIRSECCRKVLTTFGDFLVECC